MLNQGKSQQCSIQNQEETINVKYNTEQHTGFPPGAGGQYINTSLEKYLEGKELIRPEQESEIRKKKQSQRQNYKNEQIQLKQESPENYKWDLLQASKSEQINLSDQKLQHMKNSSQDDIIESEGLQQKPPRQQFTQEQFRLKNTLPILQQNFDLITTSKKSILGLLHQSQKNRYDNLKSRLGAYQNQDSIEKRRINYLAHQFTTNLKFSGASNQVKQYLFELEKAVNAFKESSNVPALEQKKMRLHQTRELGFSSSSSNNPISNPININNNNNFNHAHLPQHQASLKKYYRSISIQKQSHNWRNKVQYKQSCNGNDNHILELQVSNQQSNIKRFDYQPPKLRTKNKTNRKLYPLSSTKNLQESTTTNQLSNKNFDQIVLSYKKR